MKKTFFLFFLSILAAGIFAQDTITNKDIILMKSSKMNNDIILAKINSSQCDFDLTTSGILELKNSKIIDRIITEMLKASPPQVTMTNEDVINMYQAKLTSSVILAKIDVTEHNFDVSPEGLIKLTTAKIPKSIVKKMMDTPTGRSEKNETDGQTSSGKVLRYDEVENTRSFLNYFDVYIAKDGSIFSKGETITLQEPSKERSFQYVYEMEGLSELTYLDARYSNRELTISLIKVDSGSGIFVNRKFKFAQFVTSGADASKSIYIDIENAIASGEVKSNKISENEALETIKKAKDKFDLGLISKEEYEKIKEEMKQYIN